MRRIQIHVDGELDDALAEEAARRGVSKAALMRALLAAGFDRTPAPAGPWDAMTGWLDDDPVDSIDDVVYGPR